MKCNKECKQELEIMCIAVDVMNDVMTPEQAAGIGWDLGRTLTKYQCMMRNGETGCRMFKAKANDARAKAHIESINHTDKVKGAKRYIKPQAHRYQKR